MKKTTTSGIMLALFLLSMFCITLNVKLAAGWSNGGHSLNQASIPAEAYISVPYHKQIKSYYCGPAALEMLFDFYGLDIPQLEIADVARTASDGTYTCDMIRAAHFSNLSTSVGREMPGNITGYTARKLGYVAFEHGGFTFDELKYLIATGYPVIVLTTWHYRVVVGYNSTHVTFQDSYYGEMYNMTYEAFDIDWDYSGHWGLFVSPWDIQISTPEAISLSSVFNVTATITYPTPPPFPTDQYPASLANATITLPAGLTLVSGETTEKNIGTGELAAGASANVTWAVQASSLGIYTVSVEAEGKIAGFVPPLPSYPEPYNYEDRIGGFNSRNVRVTPPGAVSDVAVTSVAPHKTIICQGYNVLIDVTIENQGDLTESFNVIAYADATVIGTISDLMLTSGDSVTVTFTWGTTSIPYGNYVIRAKVPPVLGETDKADNTLSDGTVLLTIPGDVNGDKTVTILDAGALSAHWYPGPPVGPLGYDSNADINSDGDINILDAGIVSAHWGQSW